ncbi:MAG: toxin-antitoxin system HicB family antitoxin [Phormidesmis sp.]
MGNVQVEENLASTETQYNGQLQVNVSKTLHRKLAAAAEREGIDLNQYLVTILSEQNARRDALSEVGHAMGDVQEQLDEINRQLRPEDAPPSFIEQSDRDQRARRRRVAYNSRYVQDWESGLND